MVERKIPGDFAFDCYFTRAESLNHIQGHKRGYVGDLKSNRKVWFKGREIKAAEWAAGIASDDRQRVDIGDRKQWYVTQRWTPFFGQPGSRFKVDSLWLICCPVLLFVGFSEVSFPTWQDGRFAG